MVGQCSGRGVAAWCCINDWLLKNPRGTQGTITALFLQVCLYKRGGSGRGGNHTSIHMSCCQGTIPALFLVRYIQVYTCHVVKEQSLPCSLYGAYRYTHVMLSRNNPCLVPRTVHTGIHMSCCQGTIPALFLVRCIQVYICHVVKEQFLPCSLYGSYRYTHVMLSRNNPCLVPCTLHTGIHMSCCQGAIPALFLVRCIQVYTCHVVKEQPPPCSLYGAYR